MELASQLHQMQCGYGRVIGIKKDVLNLLLLHNTFKLLVIRVLHSMLQLNVYLLLLVNKIINGISLHANVKDVYVSKNNLYCIKILSVVNLDRKIKAMTVIQANVSVE